MSSAPQVGSTQAPVVDETATRVDSGTRHEGEAVTVGSRLGRYVVVDALGEGAMGRVVRAFDPKLGREVALKLLRNTDADARARILREAQAMAQLSHPNIVAIYDVDVADGVPFLAMEYVQGSTLGAWLAEAEPRGRPWREVIAAFDAAGRGLAAAHRVGIVHRDFKPANVLVDASAGLRVRVMDFGLARAVVGEPSGSAHPSASMSGSASLPYDGLTMAGTVMGTPAYMAPEQHAGAADARSDQYAFCVALWEALAGARPFAVRNLVEDKFALRIAERKDARPIPAHLRRVLLRGLAPVPEDRFDSMESLLRALARDPSRRRHALLAAAGVGVAIAGVLGVSWWQREQRRAACVAEGEAIADVWNPEIARAMQDAIVATGAPQAENVAQRVPPWLDEYAAAWTTARTAACVAARVDGGDPELHVRSAECLDERKATFAAVVASLTAPDGETIGRGMESAVTLPPLRPCSDAARLAESARAPDEATRTEVATLRQAISEAGALAALGRLDDAQARAEAVLERADALAFAPLVAEAELGLANVLSRRGDIARARPRLERAYFLATTAGADDVAASVATRLVDVVGLEAGEQELGLLWGRIGLAALERLGVTDDPRVAGVLHNLGSVLSDKGDTLAALDHYERALAIRERQLGPEDPLVAGTCMNLAIVHDDLGHHDQARGFVARALAIDEQTYGPDYEGVAVALNTLAHIELERGALAESRAALDRALAILEGTFGPDYPGVATTLNNLANVALTSGDVELAQRSYERARAIIEGTFGPDNPGLAYALDGLASVARARGRFDEALAHHRRALAIEERAFGAEHVAVAATLLSLGKTQLAGGDRAGAIASFGRSLAIRRAVPAPATEIAWTEFALAVAVFDDDRDQALALARGAERTLAAAGPGHDVDLAEIREQLAAWTTVGPAAAGGG